MQKLTLPIGQKIRGYGLLNEYGEFDFIPEQTGTRQGQQKLVKQADDYTISTTKKFIIVHVRLPVMNGINLMKAFMKVMNQLMTDFQTYEF